MIMARLDLHETSEYANDRGPQTGLRPAIRKDRLTSTPAVRCARKERSFAEGGVSRQSPVLTWPM
jgi:hypothetical protein